MMPLSASMAMLSEERESLLKGRHGASGSGKFISLLSYCNFPGVLSIQQLKDLAHCSHLVKGECENDLYEENGTIQNYSLLIPQHTSPME